MNLALCVAVRMTSISVVSVISSLHAGDIVFTEITDESGIDFLFDTPGNSSINSAHFWGGVGIGDFDQNGALDVFFPGGGNTHDTLYLNDGTGVFTDVSEEWGLTEVHFAVGVGVGDIDGDGWLDVAVSSSGSADVAGGQPGGYHLYRNLEGKGFAEIAEEAGVNNVATEMPQHPTYATFGDYDVDGDLDLFFGTWRPENLGNKVYRNNGDLTFTDVTEELGLATIFANSKGWSIDIVDMDGDLLPDILWVADFGRSRYFVNNGDLTFSSLTPGNGTGEDGWGMGSAVFDYNLDGLLDWYVSSIYYDSEPANTYNGNALYRQIADHVYVNLGQSAGISDGGWAWAAVAADFDQDGLEDVAVSNGTRFQEEHREEPEAIFQNQPGGNFLNVASAAGLGLACEATSVAAFDVDGDGDLDLIFLCNGEYAHLYRNDSTDQGSWLMVELGGNPSIGIPNHGFNTRIEAYVGDQMYVRYMDGRPSYGASGPQALHFGLGDAEEIDTLLVRWITGEETILTDVCVNQKIYIEAPGDAVVGDLTGDGRVDGADLTVLLGMWGECADPMDCVPDLNGDGQVDGADLSTLLGAWTTNDG